MNYESLGYGSIGGLLIAVLTFLGWNRRLNRLEETKQDCSVCDERLARMDRIEKDVAYIRERLDTYLNNLGGKE
jgi:hypothetical protein